MPSDRQDIRVLSANILYGQVSEYDIVRFFDTFLDLGGKLDRYPASSKIVQEAGHQVVEAVRRLRETPTANFSISELYHQLQVNDHPLSAAALENPIVEALLFFLLERNIRELSFTPEVMGSAVVRFFELSDQSEDERKLVDALNDEKVRGVLVSQHVDVPIVDEGQSRITFVKVSDAAATGVHDDDVLWDQFESHTPTPAASDSESTNSVEREDERRQGVRVRVVVGTHPLIGAVVKVVDHPHPPVIFEAEPGAVLSLPQGDYALEVRYESYRVLHRLSLAYGEPIKNVVVDLQKVFDY